MIINKEEMVVKKEINYPIFFECFQYITDSFWETIFEELAYGKPPYGTYISKGFLSCSYKEKEFSYKIENKNPEILYNDVMNLLSKKLGLQSQREKNKKKLDMQVFENELKDYRKCWNNIRRKNIKDLLIEQYVIDMKHKHNFDLKQAQNLLSMIYISMIFKVITSKDILYENGSIMNIEGIHFKNKKIVLDREIFNVDHATRKCILIENKKLMSDMWPKFLQNLEKLTK